ncbi:hypothetical protein BsWGS_22680 [Bradybaena similaris]
MNNETKASPNELVKLFDKEPYWKQLIYVLITDKDLHNRGTKQLLKLVFLGMVIGALVGLIFGIKNVGAAVGCLFVLWFGDKTSGEVFSLVDNLQQMPVKKKYDIGDEVVGLVKADSVVALRNYIKEPEKYSQLVQILKSNLQVVNKPREFSSLYFIVPIVLAACLCTKAISVDHQN